MPSPYPAPAIPDGRVVSRCFWTAGPTMSVPSGKVPVATARAQVPRSSRSEVITPAARARRSEDVLPEQENFSPGWNISGCLKEWASNCPGVRPARCPDADGHAGYVRLAHDLPHGRVEWGGDGRGQVADVRMAGR
ncbi:hypothetical protein [Streptomyces sp. NPDC059224]|uniref:hypothetical protein n=1 Tax=Streptomyces sp. NPDC059224 TaxID=3346775 RepID=UPI0036B4F2AA